MPDPFRAPAQEPSSPPTSSGAAAPARPVVLCADDFALTEGVSRVILALAGRGRISATSAMTTEPAWDRLARELDPHRPTLGVGLHLNLTTGRPLAGGPGLSRAGAFPSLRELMGRAFRRTLPLAEIRAEIAAQLDAFRQAAGRAPDFVDGHQHVHVLPGIRKALIEVLAKQGLAGRLWLRDPSDRLGAVLRRPCWAKALVVGAFAQGFARDAGAAGFATNAGFSGFSAFAAEPGTVADLFEGAFARLGPAPVVMCHPGAADPALRALDPVVEARPLEAAYLASERFAALLEERGLTLSPKPVVQARAGRTRG